MHASAHETCFPEAQSLSSQDLNWVQLSVGDLAGQMRQVGSPCYSKCCHNPWPGRVAGNWTVTCVMHKLYTSMMQRPCNPHSRARHCQITLQKEGTTLQNEGDNQVTVYRELKSHVRSLWCCALSNIPLLARKTVLKPSTMVVSFDHSCG